MAVWKLPRNAREVLVEVCVTPSSWWAELGGQGCPNEETVLRVPMLHWGWAGESPLRAGTQGGTQAR